MGSATHGRVRWALALAATLAAPLPALAVPRVASRDARVAGVPATARYLVDVGSFTSADDDGALCELARGALVGRLAREGAVVMRDASVDRRAVEGMVRRRRLAGYLIEGRVRVVSVASASRVEVSLVVQTWPGREYRFEAAVTVTLSGVGPRRGVEVGEATRRAVQAAASRALGQFAAG